MTDKQLVAAETHNIKLMTDRWQFAEYCYPRQWR